MKFGKQLDVGVYPAWQEKYLAYHKLKRMLKRYRFLRTQRLSLIENAEVSKARKQQQRLEKEGEEALQRPLKHEQVVIHQQQRQGRNQEEEGLLAAYGIQGKDSDWARLGLAKGGGASGGKHYGTAPPAPPQYGSHNDERGGRQQQPRSRNEAADDKEGREGAGADEEAAAAAAAAPLLPPARLDSPDRVIRLAHERIDAERRESEMEFFPLVKEELRKVEGFFKGKKAGLEEGLAVFEKNRSLNPAWGNAAGNTVRQVRTLFLELEALKTYVELNSEGFRKIIKKYDKVMDADLQPLWVGKMAADGDYSFYHSKAPEHLLERAEALISRDKLLEMKREIRKRQEGEVGREEESLFPRVKPWHVLFSLVAFALSWRNNMTNGENPHAERCLSMLVLVTCLWVTESLPYFATALLIPILTVFLGVLQHENGGDMEAPKAAKECMDSMINHTSILIMGSYSISAAFSRCELELRLASAMQRLWGSTPRLFLLGIMYLGLFLSMLIGNHTSPVLLGAIVMPIIKDLGTESRFAKGLLLGVAFSCNMGGMVTPIASMQNVVAVQQLELQGFIISFGGWLGMAVPFTLVGVLVAYFVILVIVKPNDAQAIPLIVYTKHSVLTPRSVLILALTALTVVGWATISVTKDVFGDLGIIALLFMVAMFGSGLLTEVDLNSFSWHTLILLGGGNVVGMAIAKSDLLTHIANALTKGLPEDALWLSVLELVSVTLFISTFVSHTVSSLILMPVIVKVGMQLGHPVTVTVTAALAVSAGCALPFSSFPNVTSLLARDDFNRSYLTVKDFLKAGVPMSLVSILLITSLGFKLVTDCLPVSYLVVDGGRGLGGGGGGAAAAVVVSTGAGSAEAAAAAYTYHSSDHSSGGYKPPGG